MLKKVIFISTLTLILSFYYGDKSADLVTTLFSLVLFPSKVTLVSTPNVLFSAEELKLYNGKDKPELYLAILGNVFDVTRGVKHYGPNQQYNVFVGRDASRSFVTGKFNVEDISDDVVDMNYQDLRSINHWLNFYKKEYKKVGKLIGRYFDENGNLTPHGKIVKGQLNEAELEKKKDELEKTIFPPCNVEWNAEMGTRVWCTNKSGGIVRDWIGVPRQLYEPGLKTYRCACINEENKKLGTIKEYEGCDKTSLSCTVN